MPRAERDWPGAPVSVRQVRAFVGQHLEAWDAVSVQWAAVTVVSELATNALLHAGGTFRVAIELQPRTLRIEVHDGSPAAPTRRQYENTSTTGRGMRMVEELSDDWGVSRQGRGKVVWCTILLADAPLPDGLGEAI